MNDLAVSLSIFAVIFTIFSYYVQFVKLSQHLDIRVTDILPSTTNAEDFSMFLVRLVIVNRASVSRTVCGIKLALPWKYRKTYYIEPIPDQYKLSGQNVISVITNPVTIDDQIKSLKDNIFHSPVDISRGQSTIQWITLKVSRKSQTRQHDGNIKCRLILLNVYEKTLGEAKITLTI